MNNRQLNINRKGIILGVLCAILVFTAAVYFAGKKTGENENRKEISEEESSEEKVLQASESFKSSAPEPVYPAPEYEFATEEITVELKDIDKEYTFAWVSDLHLVSDHEAGEPLGDVHAEYLDAINRRYEGLAVTDDGMHAEELWPEIVKYLNYNDFDGIIFGGDMMDYCSNSNVALMKEGLDSLHTPYIYVRADHDYGAYYGGVFFTETEARTLHKTIDYDEIANKFWDMGDFIVLGIDNSTKDMPEYYLDMAAEVCARGKPVIVVTHVPYESRTDMSLAELSIQVRNKIYYWSEASDHYNPNPVTREYLNMIYSSDAVVVQVLAGHLHALWDGMISEHVSQHIFAPAFSGSIGVVHIVPKEGK